MALPAFLMLALAALAAPPEEPRGWYECHAERQDSAGTIVVDQSIPTEGTGRPRITAWRPPIEENGVRVYVHWTQEPPVRMASGRVFVMPFTSGRVEVHSIGPDGRRTRRFAGDFPPNGAMAGAGIDWNPFLAMARGAASLEVAAVGADRRVIRSVRILAADLDRVADLVAGIQPEFDAIVADRRNRCTFKDARNMISVS